MCTFTSIRQCCFDPSDGNTFTKGVKCVPNCSNLLVDYILIRINPALVYTSYVKLYRSFLYENWVFIVLLLLILHLFSALLSCDFEEGLCGWTNEHNDDFDWTRHQSATPSLGTGPVADHTYGTPLGTCTQRSNV